MKMHVLTAAVLAALASRALLAASEGGDTWSSVESVQPSTPPLLQSAPTVEPETPLAPCASRGSEGGDTWSDLPTASVIESTYLPVVATTASLSTLQRDRPSVDPRSIYGTPLDDASSDRIIRLGAQSKWVNVSYSESVRFIAKDGDSPDRSFAWRFDVSPQVSDVDLGRVAPTDFPQRNVRVFVSPNPLYSGG
jgi:hypothetical protein